MEEFDIIVVGCGLSGCVIAERFASVSNKKVLIIEKRDHIGGNCYDYVDEKTGILVNKYGAHLFHTNNEEVWNYVNQFGEWIRWEHKVLGMVDNKLVPIPVNITTVNQVCLQHIKNEEEMNIWLKENQVQYEYIKNSEQVAKQRVGNVLYEKIFKTYTKKQWNKTPDQLKPEVLERIPIRNNFDTRYFSDKYQALPKDGYTQFFKRLLNHSNITVKLETNFFEIDVPEDKLIIYTGPIDQYFSYTGFPRLEYRSIHFVSEVFENMNYYQPNSVVNYPGDEVDFTRIVEYKHFLNQSSPHTIIIKEYSTDEGEPFYPVLNDQNIELYRKYQKMASEEKNVFFVGRLANYKYFNMDEAIKNALDYFHNLTKN